MLRKEYVGLEAHKISLESNDVLTTSNCIVASIELKRDPEKPGVCVSPEDDWEYTYIGPGEW